MKFQETNYQPKPHNIPEERRPPLILMCYFSQLRLRKTQVTNIYSAVKTSHKKINVWNSLRTIGWISITYNFYRLEICHSEFKSRSKASNQC